MSQYFHFLLKRYQNINSRFFYHTTYKNFISYHRYALLSLHNFMIIIFKTSKVRNLESYLNEAIYWPKHFMPIAMLDDSYCSNGQLLNTSVQIQKSLFVFIYFFYYIELIIQSLVLCISFKSKYSFVYVAFNN